MRVLLLNLNSETNDLVNGALAGQGYDITIESSLTVDEVLALSPEVLVTEASPTDLSCCGMITQLSAGAIARGIGYGGFADGLELLRDDYATEGAFGYADFREDPDGGARRSLRTSASA